MERGGKWMSGKGGGACSKSGQRQWHLTVFPHLRPARHAAASAFSSAISFISRMIVASWRSTICASAFISVVRAGCAPTAPLLPANC